MRMRSDRPGRNTSVIEVTHISTHGFWLLLPEGEAFLPFETFPWFRDATVSQIQHVVLLHSSHLYWPDLDVDLAVESIHHPERYPLVSKEKSGKPVQGSARAERVREKPRTRRRVDQ
jgi:hypothetical protein